LVKNDEKDLPAPQSTSETHPRLYGPNGDAGRSQCAQAPPRQGAPSPRHNHPAQAAGVEPSRTSQSFSARDKLRRPAQFRWLQRKGARAESGHFVIYLGRLDETRQALGVTVSRKIGGAVVRNRIKRRIRECFRRGLKTMLPEETSMVVIARTGAGDIDFASTRAELVSAIELALRRLNSRR